MISTLTVSMTLKRPFFLRLPLVCFARIQGMNFENSSKAWLALWQISFSKFNTSISSISYTGDSGFNFRFKKKKNYLKMHLSTHRLYQLFWFWCSTNPTFPCLQTLFLFCHIESARIFWFAEKSTCWRQQFFGNVKERLIRLSGNRWKGINVDCFQQELNWG